MELSLLNLTKQYDQHTVLEDITCTLKPGIYGFLGANGSGKTTLFRSICGVIHPDSGEVLYNQKNIFDQFEAFRSVLGFLPQEFSYYPDFTGLKFMLYIAALKGLHPKIAKKKSLELLSLVGLTEVQHKKIKKYSGGMKQRLGIAQSLLNDPKILILDEPTVGLDPKERVRFRNLISSFSHDKIILLSTHIVSDIEYIADQILILKDGKLRERGTASDLVQTIAGYVWEVTINQKEALQLLNQYAISNQKQCEEGTVLRIITPHKPAENARSVEPTLEDLYLYYFREEAAQ